jgi:putative transposase
MPRIARLSLPDVAVHVIQRGNNRSVCFPSERDFAHYLHLLRRFSAVNGCAVHAYCLMPNHTHLLLTPQLPGSCAALMKQLGQLHAQHINASYKRTGTVWEGRFKSCLVQSQSYVLACYRYIELNPVRAGLVSQPSQYRWSSFMTNGAGVPDPMISPHPEYLALAKTWMARLKSYVALFGTGPDEGVQDQIRMATRGGFALGDERFRKTLSEQLGRRVVPRKAGRPKAARPESGQFEIDF